MSNTTKIKFLVTLVLSLLAGAIFWYIADNHRMKERAQKTTMKLLIGGCDAIKSESMLETIEFCHTLKIRFGLSSNWQIDRVHRIPLNDIVFVYARSIRGKSVNAIRLTFVGDKLYFINLQS